MAKNKDNRLNKIEQRLKPEGERIIVILNWGDDDLSVNGEHMSREELEQRYPDGEYIYLKVVYEDWSKKF